MIYLKSINQYNTVLYFAFHINLESHYYLWMLGLFAISIYTCFGKNTGQLNECNYSPILF